MPVSEALTRTTDLTYRDLTLRSSTIRAQDRTVQGVLATDQPVTVYDWDTGDLIDEVLLPSGAEYADQLPLLESHLRGDLDYLVGSIRQISTEANQIVGTLYLAKGDERAERHWRKIEQGHLTDLSIGYRILEAVLIEAGESADVASQTYTATARRLRVAVRYLIKEGSLVTIGADIAAKLREQRTGPTAPHKKEPTMPATIKPNPTATDDSVPPANEPAGGERSEPTRPAASPPEPRRQDPPADPPADTPDLQAERAAATRAERQRIARITELAGQDVPEELLRAAVDEGLTPEAAGLRFFEAVTRNRPDPLTDARVTADAADKRRAVMIDAICIRSGINEAMPAERISAAADFRQMTLQDLARTSLLIEGVRQQIYNPSRLFERAVSTGSFPYIVTSSVARILQRAYTDYPSTASQWCGRRDVNDFKQVRDVKLSGFSSLAQVGNGGEIPHGTLSEATETHQAYTYGRMLQLTRTMFINDDLGAFARAPALMGAAAKRNIEDLVYALLVSASGVGPTMNEDSKALFHASHASGANYLTGTPASVLGDTGLAAARVAMRKMKGLAGEILNLIPRGLLVPVALEHTARKLVESQELLVTTGEDTTIRYGTKNVHQGSLQVITEPRLDAATNGATAWYLTADAMMAESIVIVYLRGQTEPTVERADPVDVLGIGWRVYHDCGAAAVDFRGINRSKGA